mgnify:CR=1 FL=1
MRELGRDSRAVSGTLIGLVVLVVLGTSGRVGPIDRSDVTFPTADGGEIHALLYGSGDQTVVLAHGMVFDKESWAPLVPRLVEAGLQVLAIDFRGYGESRPGRAGGELDLDIVGAVEFLREQGANRISLLGASMGGGAVARAAVRLAPGEIDRLILLAPVAISHPDRMRADRIIYISAAGDPSIERTRDQFARAPEPKRLELLPGEAHAQHLFKTDQSDALVELIVTALKD